MATNFNVSPYYDDFAESKNFHRVLFRPSFSVQGRELTQLQTILQNQIERFGEHVFKDGAMVIPGQVTLNTDYEYLSNLGLTLNKIEEMYSEIRKTKSKAYKTSQIIHCLNTIALWAENPK